MIVDQRFLAATKDAVRARQMLIELHGQILNVQDPHQLAELVGKYAALATSPQRLAPSLRQQMQKLNDMYALLSNIIKSQHDQNMKAIQNLKG